MGSIGFCATLCLGFIGGVTGLPAVSLNAPDSNVWLVLAKATNTSTMCLSIATPTAPFRTCLVGILLASQELDTFYNVSVQSP